MRQKLCEELEKARNQKGIYATRPGSRCGAFYLRCPVTCCWLTIVASDGSGWKEDAQLPGEPWAVVLALIRLLKWKEDAQLPGEPWEHVSVSAHLRCPSWQEMAWVKDLFFEPEECVMQLHPPQSRYVNEHEHTLHLWRPIGVAIPMPPLQCV